DAPQWSATDVHPTWRNRPGLDVVQPVRRPCPDPERRSANVDPVTTVPVTCCQLSPRIGDLAGNVERSTAAVRIAVACGADVVVLPELVTSGYVFESVDEVAGTAITPAHAVFEKWSNAAA